MKICCVTLLGVAVAALLSGCAGDEGVETAATPPASARHSEPLTGCPRKADGHPAEGRRNVQVALDGHRGPENAGILLAAELGYFADVGINATITSPLYPVRSLVYVEDRTVDIGVSHQPQVVMGQEEGESLVAVGSLISQPTAAMIWLEKSQIRSVADLEGRTVAIPDLPFQEEFLGALLARAGLTLEDVEVEVVGYELVPALISGQADAIFGGSWNVEGAELESRGLKPVVTRVQRLGIPAYDELVVIARSDLVAKEPELIREFMAAVARGTAAAVEDPKGVVEAIEQSDEKDPESTREGIEAGVEATLPLLSRTGYMDPGQADRLVDWMHEQGLIEEEPAAAAFLTNSCLPKS